MKRILYTLGGATLFAIPSIVSLRAAGIVDGTDGGAFGDLLGNILAFGNTVLIPFIIGIGFLFFVWGMFLYFIAGGHDEEKQKSGKQLMIYATLGFVLIIIFWGLVNFLASSIGLEGKTLEDIPQII
jgi:hypothetical protein